MKSPFTLLAILAFTCSGMYACSSDDKPAPAGSSGSSGGLDGGGDTSSPIDGGGGQDAPSTTSKLALGDIPTLDEPDVPCVATAGLKTTLFPGGGNGGPPVTRVQKLGARRFAAGLLTQGFITFDAVGTTPNLFSITLGTTETAFSSEGTTIGAMAASTGKVEYQRYDDQGAVSGGLVSVATGIVSGPSRLWIASGGGGTLAVWPSGTTLSAAAITAAGTLAGPPFTLATNAENPHIAITYSADKYAIAYSYKSGTAAALRFVYANTAGLVGAPIDIGTADAMDPVAITPTSAGFVMVVDAGGDDHVYTVPLDATGKLSGMAHRLLGGDLPQGIASHAGDVALVVLTNDVKVGNMEGPRAPQFRPLDITGKPTGPWVCFDQKFAATFYQDMGILAEDSGGYSVVYKSAADASVLIRTDKLGTGAP